MATEVGIAYVRLMPSMDGFGRRARTMLDRELGRLGDRLTVRIDADVRLSGLDTRGLLAGIRVDADRAGSSLQRIGAAAGTLGRVSTVIGGIGTALGATVPLAAGLAATLAEVAPAAGVAATGMLAMTSAQAAVRIGMVGVEDAISAALDPSQAEEFNEALERLSPNARAFAVAIRDAQPALDAMRRSIQDRLFQDLDTALQDTAQSTLPALRQSLEDSAASLNAAGRGALAAGRELGESGTLGQALRSANTGLRNLTGLPALVVTGFGQIAAAAGPSFERLTSAAAGAAERIAARLSDAADSGALQDAIEHAVTLLGDLADVAGNVGRILGGLFGAAQVSGTSFVGTLESITGAMADAVATDGVREALEALMETAGTLGRTIAPLLGSALAALGPVVSALAPPVQRLIEALGDALQPIIDALGPVLLAAAGAVGALLDAISPVLPVAGQLIAQLGPILTPIIRALGDYIRQAAPLWQQWVMVLASALMPVLAALAESLGPLLAAFGELTEVALPLAQQLMTELSPQIAQIGRDFAAVLVALTPLIAAWLRFMALGLRAATPLISGVIRIVGALARALSGTLSGALNRVVIPVLTAVSRLLRGDFSGATNAAGRAVVGFARVAISAITMMPRLALAGLRGVGSLLYSSGRALIGGLVSGIRSMARSVVNAVSGVLSSARNLLPFSPAKEGPFSGRGWTLYSGQAISEGLAQGILAGRAHALAATRALVDSVAFPLGTVTPAAPGLPTAAMAAPVATAAPPVVQIVPDGSRASQALVEALRYAVRVGGGGNVQQYIGQNGR